MDDIHLDTQVFWQGAGHPIYIFLLTTIALLILLIACINYISLSLIPAFSSNQRSREYEKYQELSGIKS